MHFLPVVVLASITVQADTTQASGQMAHQSDHRMFEVSFAQGWRVAGMAQVFPIATFGSISAPGSPLDEAGYHLTQTAAMVNLESPSRRFSLRVTPNLEGITQEDGELTFGGWGEGFIDRRHPHTILHEVMASLNLWGTGLGDLSISAGKGFAPYGTDDPMSRPSVKYPTNHHLSQILERFTVNAVLLRGPWGLEAGVFGGAEPDGPYDFSNIESFADSWSIRGSRRFGVPGMAGSPWEASASIARVRETHGDEEETMRLFNTAVRYASTGMGGVAPYGLLEYSVSDPEHGEGYWSVLGEGSFRSGPHQPYLRVERAMRPEFDREGSEGDGFFRYDHDAEAIGSTSWTILSAGYGFTATTGSVSIRPFVEAQYFRVGGERGGIDPRVLFGDRAFAAFTIGARVFLGGDPMRMGSYGVLDPMTRMGRMGGMNGME